MRRVTSPTGRRPSSKGDGDAGGPGNEAMIRVGRTIARVAVVTCVFAVACLPALTLMGMASFSLALAAEVPEVVFDLSITAGAVQIGRASCRERVCLAV